MKFINPSVSIIYKNAILFDGLDISDKGALLAYSGSKTGRSPKDKRIVSDGSTKDIWWGNINIPLNKTLFTHYQLYASHYLLNKEILYQMDCYANWDNNYRYKIRIFCTNAYHALFMKNMLIQSDENFSEPDFTIYNVGEISLQNASKTVTDLTIKDESLQDTVVAIDFSAKQMVIYGTMYAGEMKKGILTMMMYYMPLRNQLPLHSSANIVGNNLAIFLGLSGTGKTTLSADPSRQLIGDDEHVWSDTGLFNIEGGCYAKCVNLDKLKEPEIYEAIKYGALLENVKHNDFIVDYNDKSITENTRCSYPLSHISNSLIPALVEHHPSNIIFLTCDLQGLLPPVSKLTMNQAVLFFVSGYTSKVAGTEVKVSKPEIAFSACFGEPFLVWNPTVYGNLLKNKLIQHKCNVWLVNTGWINGGYGIGQRISIANTRIIINNIHNGTLMTEKFKKLPIFDIEIPGHCAGISDQSILDPSNSWPDVDAYIGNLKLLHKAFMDNLERKNISI